MENINYLFVAYGVVWVFMFLYLFSIAAREKKIQKELAELNRLVSRSHEERRAEDG